MAEGLTKKQIKELRKLEKMQARSLEQKNDSVKWIAISIASALFLLLFIGIVLVAKNKNAPVTSTENAQFANARNERMITSGQDQATTSADPSEQAVTLVEFADIQCPACRTYNPVLKEVLAAYPDRVKIVFKHFPLISIHPNAMPAAIAAEAAGKQNKFFEFADLAYERQGEWSGLANPQQKFEEYAKTIGLNIEQFRKDQTDPEIEKAINTEREEGIANGVNSTPTFFLEGQRLQVSSSLDEFKKAIDEALKKKSNTQTSVPVTPTVTSAPDSLPLQP